MCYASDMTARKVSSVQMGLFMPAMKYVSGSALLHNKVFSVTQPLPGELNMESLQYPHGELLTFIMES